MKTPRDTDPTRWRDLSPPRSETELEIGAAARMLGASTPPDEFRLAQLRQRVLARQETPSRPLHLLGQRWFRTAVLVLASLCVGGVATAVTGRLIARRRLDQARSQVNPRASDPQAARRSTRRWRVAVNAPARLDLAVGRDETELSVVEGRADITGADALASTTLEPGMSWRGAASDAVPSPLARVLSASSTPNTSPSATLPALVPSRGVQPAAPQGSPPRPRTHRESRRALAIARGSDGDMGAVPSSAPPARAGVLVEAVSTPPRLPDLSPPTLELAPRAVPPSTPPLRASTPASSPSAPRRISEAALLGRALRHLRTDHDPKGALAQIDEHDRRFPEGAFKRESALARAEALLARERKASALAVLDALKLEGTTVDRRIELARGELRASRGRLFEAFADFDAVVRSGLDDDIAARALFGRALLRARAGDTAGALDDLREYLRRPNSPRRDEAERTLRRLGG